MGRKAKYTKEQKVQACVDYLSGRKSAEQIKIELNMGKCGTGLVRKWVKSYRVNGHSIFDNKLSFLFWEIINVVLYDYEKNKGEKR